MFCGFCGTHVCESTAKAFPNSWHNCRKSFVRWKTLKRWRIRRIHGRINITEHFMAKSNVKNMRIQTAQANSINTRFISSCTFPTPNDSFDIFLYIRFSFHAHGCHGKNFATLNYDSFEWKTMFFMYSKLRGKKRRKFSGGTYESSAIATLQTND